MTTADCLFKIGFNCYNCRMSEVVDTICPGEDEDHDFTDDELERMTLRPGIERALDKEHGKVMKKMEVEMGDLSNLEGSKSSWKSTLGLE